MTVDAGLRQILRTGLPKFDWTTIEMGATGKGAPDCNYCYDGIEGWIECKKADHWRIVVRPEQVGWAERRIAHGGRVYVAVRRARNELWLYHGWMLRRLKHERIDDVPSFGFWVNGPAKWNWLEIQRILTQNFLS